MPVICPFSTVHTNVLLAITSIPWCPRKWPVFEATTAEPASVKPCVCLLPQPGGFEGPLRGRYTHVRSPKRMS